MTTIVKTLNDWQQEIMTSNKLVHVSGFSLKPQAQGFQLMVELYIANKYDPELPNPYQYFYGTLEECFTKALGWISMEKDTIRELL